MFPAFGVKRAGNSPVVLPSVLLSFRSPSELLNHVDVECLCIIFPICAHFMDFCPSWFEAIFYQFILRIFFLFIFIFLGKAIRK